jgi:hypothetical protein
MAGLDVKAIMAGLTKRRRGRQFRAKFVVFSPTPIAPVFLPHPEFSL